MKFRENFDFCIVQVQTSCSVGQTKRRQIADFYSLILVKNSGSCYLLARLKISKQESSLISSRHVSSDCSVSGVSFETSSSALIDQIPSALGVFADAVENFIEIPANQVEYRLVALLYKKFRTCRSLQLCPAWMVAVPTWRPAGPWATHFISKL